jgi:hypothetical protein
LAIAAPMPFDAQVTIAVFPANLGMLNPRELFVW